MEKTNELEGYMTDSQGRLVLSSAVKVEDKMEDELVRGLINGSETCHNLLTSFKENSFDEIKAFIELLSEKYQVNRGGKKGGVTLTSYDGKLKVQVSVQDFISFGPQLQIAKDLVDGCIRRWGENNGDKNIQALVEHAFRVDKNNRINVSNILGLKRINIDDEEWMRAMRAIDDSIRVLSSKEYIRFYKRPSANDEWEAITLDIAKV